MYSKGEMIPPWGTPECSCSDFDSVSPIFTFCDLFDKKDLNHFTVFSLKPYNFSLPQRMSVSRQSKAAERSHIKIPVFSLFSVFSAHCFWTSVICWSFPTAFSLIYLMLPKSKSRDFFKNITKLLLY